MLYARDSREFKCVQGICRLLGWPCDHSQRLGLLQTSKPREKAADGNVPHVQLLLNVFKIHMMMMLVNMARKFEGMVKHQNSLFVLRAKSQDWNKMFRYSIRWTAYAACNRPEWSLRFVNFGEAIERCHQHSSSSSQMVVSLCWQQPFVPKKGSSWRISPTSELDQC